MAKQPKIVDLAAHVGLDKATVSRALNNRPGVAPQTRQRVLEAARQLGYQPNIHGQQLRGWQSKTLGLVLSADPGSLSMRFYGPFVLQFVIAAAQQGYDLLIVFRDQHPDENLADVLNRRGVNGALLLGQQSADILDAIRDAEIPAVQTAIYSDAHPEIGFVASDDFAATRQLTRRLIKLGHRHLGVIGHPWHLSSFRDRYAGFQAALEKAGLAEITADVDRQDTERYIRAVLSADPRPTALVGLSDTRAAQAIHVARELGLEIPVDLSITGFDDVDRVLIQSLSLTTVRIHQDRIAHAAIEELLNFTMDAPPIKRLVPSELVHRGSVGPPPMTLL